MIRKASIISGKTLNETIRNLQEKNERGTTIYEDPKMFLIDMPPGFVSKPEVHEQEDDIYFILNGYCTITIDKQEYEVTKGDLIHIPQNLIHQITKTKEGVSYVVVKIQR